MRTKYIFANYVVHLSSCSYIFAHSIVCCNCKFTNHLILNGNKMMKNEVDMVSHLEINLHCFAFLTMCDVFIILKCIIKNIYILEMEIGIHIL